MGASAEHGEAFNDLQDHSRRAFAAGLIGAGLCPDIAWSQVDPQAGLPPPFLPGEIGADERNLLANLLTRMATRTHLNGRAGFSFVIDTGAGRTAIAQDVAEALELPPGPEVLVHGVTSAERAQTVRLARLNFGNRRFDDLTCPVFPRALIGSDGLLGLDVLSRFELSFDLNRRTVKLKPSDSDVVTVSHTLVVPSRLTHLRTGRARQGRFGQLILVNTRAEDVEVEAFIDSGAQYSIGNLALLRAIGTRSDGGVRPTPVSVYGVTGQTLLAQPGLVRQLELARQRMGPTPLLFADLHAFRVLDLIERPALLIGADILYRFRRVSLDFGNSRMTFSGLKRRPVETV
jgi:gag-polyprotein putative aspartyl protease